MSPTRVAVLYNAPVLPRDHPDAASEADVVQVAGEVAEALNGAGFEAGPLAVGVSVVGLVADLAAYAPDVVFNLVEGFGGRSIGEAHLTGLLELLKLPYTGSPPGAMSLCLSKGRTKALLRGFGLPTAPFAVVAPGEAVPRREWLGPVVVKPDDQDGSLGIDQESVVSDLGAIADRVERLRASYGGPVLIEAYLPGPEYNVGAVALPDFEALPVAEVVYAPRPGSWPILTYEAKWSPGSAGYGESTIACPAPIERALADELGRLASAALRATGCRDYARVDLRLDDRGRPMILEVNPNPDIGPAAGWARALRVSGRDYAATLAALVRRAWERGN